LPTFWGRHEIIKHCNYLHRNKQTHTHGNHTDSAFHAHFMHFLCAGQLIKFPVHQMQPQNRLTPFQKHTHTPHRPPLSIYNIFRPCTEQTAAAIAATATATPSTAATATHRHQQFRFRLHFCCTHIIFVWLRIMIWLHLICLPIFMQK